MITRNTTNNDTSMAGRVPAVLARLALLACCILFGCGFMGCDEVDSRSTVLVVLIDETTSYIQADMWESSIDLTGKVIEMLRPGDYFIMLGIDNHGFDGNDVRIPITELPNASLPSMKAKHDLKEAVLGIEVRESSSGYRLEDGTIRGTPWGTDQLGSLHHVSELISSPVFDDARVRVIVYSDFFDEPPRGGSGATRSLSPFSGDCRIMAVNVLESKPEDPNAVETVVGEDGEIVEEEVQAGGEEFNNRRTAWLAIFTNMGLNCTTNHFITTGGSSEDIVLPTIDTWLRPPARQPFGPAGG